MSTQARAAIPSPETSLGDSFAWPFRDPEWFNKIVLMGLIGIIPIVGWLQLLGWMLAALDNLRHGWQVLPPAGFRYATRGINLFAASLIWVWPSRCSSTVRWAWPSSRCSRWRPGR